MNTSDIDHAAAVLADAFTGYPWTDWCVPADHHFQRLEGLQRIYVEHMALPFGAAYIDESGNGVAAFVPPDLPEPTPEIASKLVDLHGDRFDQLVAAEQRMTALPSDRDAWVLATVGVVRAGRGTGLGSALLSAGLADLDRYQRACQLDTSTARNLSLYERHGFAITGHLRLESGVEVWRMHRPTVGSSH